MEENIWKKRFMVYVTVEVPIDFTQEDATLEDAYDCAQEYMNDYNLVVSEMVGWEVTEDGRPIAEQE